MTATNHTKTEEEIFKKALDLLIERAKADDEDFLKLNPLLVDQANCVPLFTPNRGAYNMTFQINKLFKKIKIENWKSFESAEEIADETLKNKLAIYHQAKSVIESANQYAKNKFDEMVSDSIFTPEDIVMEMYSIKDLNHYNTVNSIEALYDLAELYATITIIRVFKDLQETRNFTVNMKKLRCVFLELRFDENGNQYIEYEVMIKRGTPATRHFVKVKSYKGKITTS